MDAKTGSAREGPDLSGGSAAIVEAGSGANPFFAPVLFCPGAFFALVLFALRFRSSDGPQRS